MASKFIRGQNWWVKFRHPASGSLIRESLETTDEAQAELLRERIDLEVALCEPRFQAAEVPGNIWQHLGKASGATPLLQPSAQTAPQFLIPAPPVPHTPLDEALRGYLNFIKADNAPRHVANKLSMLRRFLGSGRVAKIAGPSKFAERNTRNKPFFTGEFVNEVSASLLQRFFEDMPLGRKTKRHYREFFHHFFEYCIKSSLYQPTNFHYPNPVSSLPGFCSKNEQIIFLTQEQIDEQLKILEPHPQVRIAVAVMIYAGLRRAEALWLGRDAIAGDSSFLSIINRTDSENDIESTLKTGARAVTILPALQPILKEHMASQKGRWIVASPEGKRWDGDNFGRKLRAINAAAGLNSTCLHYRHTYATQRASEGWPLFHISKEMGNSVAVVEKYYAGFIRPRGLATAA